MAIAFAPCVGRRAQVDAVPVSDGQFLVAVDTGEAFVDYNGIRVRISGDSSGGGRDDDDDDDSHGLLTAFSIVNAALLMSDSVPGGGPGTGVFNTPAVLFGDEAAYGCLPLITRRAIAHSALLVSDSVPGGGPGDGLSGTPETILPEAEGVQTTSYSITEAR